MDLNHDNYLIFSGSSNLPLAEKIVQHLGKTLGKAKLGTFSDGEIRFQSLENVRGADVFVVQSLTLDINFHIMELLLMADAFKRASARRITAVIPYYAYARQDRKDRPRVAISAKLIADLLETSGFSRVLTIDLHANQIQGFFNIPVDNLIALPTVISYFKNMEGIDLDNVVVVSPDAGGVERARLFSQEIHAGLAIAYKSRPEPGVARLMHIIGDVQGKDTIIVDDIIDTAGTMVQTVHALKDKGASRVFAVCTHGLFSGEAIERIENSPLEKVYVSDSIPLKGCKAECKKIGVLSVSDLFAKAINSIHEETSVSELFLVK
ncbi:MAG: ribose-phosphate diphosphokinase [Candidatus Aminicenantes bacterium]|nr:ribose-phosphate diphosphokinase [Candidatus Aminicenantes bacterium]NIM79418.1 ribose-phosphate diphosphokinase [Candidatus Aminicenantes bacterium]NIN18700.1 ribose-phosphate diphosphokinase [Candidatus Aminicenantes bacterium]NIN42624.1 ribose-phosphate diphosphokinase [Candidatus Aminicenantes bacterium]NIN85363.1 ribose-phosphate diphosphokinase [Candidatus Aminicenantes bacterium]